MKFNLDTLRHKKIEHNEIITGLILLLLLLIFFNWKWGINMIQEASQLKNDLQEQRMIIQIEEDNLESLERLSKNQKNLSLDMKKVESALPYQDEKVEDVISLFEDMALKDQILIDGIGIRVIPESQMIHDALIGSVDVLEYNFSVESYLPNLLSFIRAIRSSYRLMDVMAMEIEKKEEGIYRAGFIVNVYHLKTPQND